MWINFLVRLVEYLTVEPEDPGSNSIRGIKLVSVSVHFWIRQLPFHFSLCDLLCAECCSESWLYIWQVLHRSFFLLSFNYLVFWRRCANLHYCDRVTLSAFVSHQLWLISEHYLRLAVMVVSFHGILGFLTGCLGVSTGFGSSSM